MARHAMRYRGTGRCGPDLGELSWQATTPTTTRWSKTLCSPLQLHSCSMPASRHWSAIGAALCGGQVRWQTWGSCVAISPQPRWDSRPGTRRSGVFSACFGLPSGGAAPRSSERPCAQRAVSGSRKRPQLPTGLPARCLPARASASSIGQKNNLVDRVAVHIQATQVQAPEAASIATHGQRRDDDDLLLHRRIRPDPCSSHDPG